MQCAVDIPKISGLEDNQLTVGREFFLICKGDWPKDLQQENLQFAGDENMKYTLKVQGFEFRSPEEADIKVVSYVAGPVQIPALVITDGQKSVELGQVSFQVASVLPQQQTQEQTQEKVEPYGPFGPATIPVPWVYWLAFAGTLLIAGSLVALKVWRWNQRRSMLLRLKEHDVALAPMLEFHQSMRKLQRANPVFYGKAATPEELRAGTQELARMFKVFLIRRLKVPAFEWGERMILADIRRYHPAVHAEYAKKIQALFLEFRKAESAETKLSASDLSQLAQALRKNLEGIEVLLSQEEAAAQKGKR